MAKFKFGVLVVAARGTIGGITFSANTSGPFGRVWSKGSNPKTPKQQTQRSFIATQAQAWVDLTSGQRDAWDTYAALPAQEKENSLGESYFASGFNWFTGLNANQLNAGQPPVVTAPVPPVPTAPTFLTASVTIGPPAAASIGFPAGTFLPDLLPVVFVSKRRNQTNINTGPTSLLTIAAFPGAMVTTLDLTTELEDLYGEIQEGYRYYFVVSKQDPDNGRRGESNRVIGDEA